MKNFASSAGFRVEINNTFDFLSQESLPVIQPLTCSSIGKEVFKQTTMFGASLFSAIWSWAPSKRYATRIFYLLGVKSQVPEKFLQNFLAVSGTSTNTLQSWDIGLELVDRVVEGRSGEYKKLVGEETKYKAIKNNPGISMTVILSFFSLIPIGFIAYSDVSNFFLAILIAAANFAVNYEGVDEFRKRLTPPNPMESRHIHNIKKAQAIFADVLEHAFDNAIQEVEINSKLAGLQGQKNINYLDVLLTIGNSDKNIENGEHVYRAEPTRSKKRWCLIILMMLFTVIPQSGYVSDSWKAANMVDKGDNYFAIFSVLLSGVVYAGLTLESAEELGSRIKDDRKNVPMLLSPQLRRISIVSIALVGIFSGATLALTNFENFYQDETNLIKLPLIAAALLEGFGHLSDACANVYYSFKLIDHLLRSWYCFRSQDDEKRRLALFEKGVQHTAKLFRHMTAENFQCIINDGFLPELTISRILQSNGMSQKDVTSVFTYNVFKNENTYLFDDKKVGYGGP